MPGVEYEQHSIDSDPTDPLFMRKQLKTHANLNLMKRLRALRVLVIDEISMVSPEVLEHLSKVLGPSVRQAIWRRAADFCGRHVRLARDHRSDVTRLAVQVEPSLCFFDDKDQPLLYPFQTDCWKRAEQHTSKPLRTIELTEIVRQSDPSQKKFVEILHRARVGNVSRKDVNYLRRNSRMPDNIPGPNCDADCDDASDSLFATNAKTDLRNDVRLKAVEGDTYTFDESEYTFLVVHSKQTVPNANEAEWEQHLWRNGGVTREDQVVQLPTTQFRHPSIIDARDSTTNDYVQKLRTTCRTHDLKVGARVRFTHNIYSNVRGETQLVAANGEMGFVRQIGMASGPPITYWGKLLELPYTFLSENMSQDMPMVQVELDCGTFIDVECIPCTTKLHPPKRITLFSKETVLKAVTFRMPLRVAFARTFHTAQGQTISSEVDNNLANVYHKGNDGKWTPTAGAATQLSAESASCKTRFVGYRDRTGTGMTFHQTHSWPTPWC